MAKETITRCDGCDKADVNVTDVEVHMGAAPLDKTDETLHYDMCIDCEARLYKAADPKLWPRRKRTRKDAAGG